MSITPLDVIVRTPVVKVFLANATHELVVTNKKIGYSSLLEFFIERYKYYEENGTPLKDEHIGSQKLIYNIQRDMGPMYTVCGLSTN